jgi:SAM-dependent methyltransferase
VSAPCPACLADGHRPFEGRGRVALLACLSCGSASLDTERHPYRPEALYDASYFDPWDMQPGSPAWTLRAETAAARLGLLSRLGGSGRLLDLGCAGGYLVAEAVRRGFDAQGLEIAAHAVAVAENVVPGRVRQGVIETAELGEASLDVITAFDVVEHHPRPDDLLARVRALLTPGGLFCATVPDRSSLSAFLMRSSWPHYKEEHLFYPSRTGFRRLLERASLRIVHEEAARKHLSLAYVAPLFDAYPVPVLTALATRLARALPRVAREARFTLTIGERLYVARRAA